MSLTKDESLTECHYSTLQVIVQYKKDYTITDKVRL